MKNAKVRSNIRVGAEELFKARKYVGKTIKGAYLDCQDEENIFYLEFADNSKISIKDDGQQCCERRYMSTDDKLEYLIGSEFLDISVKKTVRDDIRSEKGELEICFVEVLTNKGGIILETHNDHNGYYSGFDLVINEF